jgi:hypothetical protein
LVTDTYSHPTPILVVAITGMGGTYLFVHRHQERRRRRPMHQTIDDLFAGGLLDRLLIPTT